MRCREVQELLSEYMDGQLDESRQEKVSAHLQECGECSRELAELQKTVDFLHRMPVTSPPDEFRSRLREQINAGPGTRNNTGFWGNIAGKPAMLAAVAAVCIFAIGFSLVWYGLPGKPGKSNLAGDISGTKESVEQDKEGIENNGKIESLEEKRRRESAPPGTGAPLDSGNGIKSAPSPSEEDSYSLQQEAPQEEKDDEAAITGEQEGDSSTGSEDGQMGIMAEDPESSPSLIIRVKAPMEAKDDILKLAEEYTERPVFENNELKMVIPGDKLEEFMGKIEEKWEVIRDHDLEHNLEDVEKEAEELAITVVLLPEP